MRFVWLLLSTVTLWCSAPHFQDPQPTRPPAPPTLREPLGPVEVPYVESVPRADLPERFTAKDPIEGVWELRDRTQGGVNVEPGKGYLAIGRRHMFTQFQAPGPDPDIALLRAASYSWTRVGDGDLVRTTVLVGHYNDADGDVHVEPAGSIELRRFERLDGFLRVHREGGDWLQFARVE